MKLLRIIWLFYGVYIAYQAYAWKKGYSIAVDHAIYNRFYTKKLGFAIGILVISVLLHYSQKTTWAKWVAGTPAAVYLAWLFLMVMAWVVTWALMTFGGK